MLIEIYSYDYSRLTPAKQMEKVLEELKELEEAGDRLDHVAEEAFDVMQALTGYLITLGIDVKKANQKHIKKLEGRARS